MENFAVCSALPSLIRSLLAWCLQVLHSYGELSDAQLLQVRSQACLPPDLQVEDAVAILKLFKLS